MSEEQPEIGIFGGSGLYQLLESPTALTIKTPYGAPSDAVHLGDMEGRRVAFLPRHGSGHTIPPHRINYRANLWALHSLGVQRIIGPGAVGSLRQEHRPGDIVVCDQLVDRTHSRADTYFDGPQVAHVSVADPYCPELRGLAITAASLANFTVHNTGTGVVIQGPRFSTRAESKWFSSMGWNVVGMTQYPEVILARELGMCYVNLSLVTDYDCGLEGHPGVSPVTHEEVLRVFAANTQRLKGALTRLVATVPTRRGCDCQAGVLSVMEQPSPAQ